MSDIFKLTADKVYDPAINAYVDLNVTSSAVPKATVIKDGLMSKEDFTKLNKLYFPTPSSTLSSEDCTSNTGAELRFKNGYMRLYGSEYISVEDKINLKNINYQGDMISQLTPYNIHTFTYGFNLNIDTDKLFRYLEDNKQVIIQGRKGPKGNKGPKGESGRDRILSGPQGDKGEDGNALPCSITVSPETVENTPVKGLGLAISDAYIKVDPLNPKKYSLVLVRKVVGREDLVADKLNVTGQSSTWLLVTPSQAGVNNVFYLDIQPILNELKKQYDNRVQNLKEYYENRIAVWVQAMSDLFDQQKAALCCALQYCNSAQKNIETRRHIENLAAAALPDATLAFCSKTSADATFISADQACEKMDTDKPDCFKRIDIICPPVTNAAISEKLENNTINISAINNIDSISAAKLELKAGKYVVTVTSTDSYISNNYSVRLKLRYGSQGKTITLMDKGEYFSQNDSSNAYVGLTTEIDHDGGLVLAWTNTIGSSDNQGSTSLTFTPIDSIYEFKTRPLKITRDKLIDLFNNYAESRSFVVRVSGQEYVAVILGPEHGKLYTDLLSKGINATIAVPLIGDIPIVDYDSFYLNSSATESINRSLRMNDTLQVGSDIVKEISYCFMPINET